MTTTPHPAGGAVEAGEAKTRREREGAAYRAAIARVRPRDLMANARHIIRGRVRQPPNWVLAMDLYSLGSTYGWHLCVEEGIDPEGFDSTPAADPAARALPLTPKEDRT